MQINKVRVKNYRSIKDSGDVEFSDNLFVLAGQNESGKSSILEALNAYESSESARDNLNFELENNGDLIQEISCTYRKLDEDYFESLIEEIWIFIKGKNVKTKDLPIESVISVGAIKSIKNFTITRSFDFSSGVAVMSEIIDVPTIGKLKKAILNIKNESEGSTTLAEPSLDIDLYATEIANIFWQYTPRIILFNDFTTLLPDSILLSDVNGTNVQGGKAVKNLEKLLSISFEKIAQKSIAQKNSTVQKESDSLSVNFQKDWKQKIYGNNNVNLKFSIENNQAGAAEISFFIETKNNELLSPRKRSKGMIWFLSLWLELKAQEDESNMILLFDEPGLHLHIKASKDMLSVFHKLIRKGHQVVYSTHSPSLIETNKLHNIGLVINNENDGTTIEGLTTSKVNTGNKRDALQPIAEAMGMEPLKDFSILKHRNVLLEGLSDFWYLKGMHKILRSSSNYEFVPGIGIKGTKMYPIISFCIGYGLDWVLLMDGGELPRQTKKDLKEQIFFNDEDETNKKIKLLDEEEIENLFHLKDLQLVDGSIKENSIKSPVELIGGNRKMLFAKLFYDKVEKEDIKKEHIHESTVKKFNKIFDWIDERFA